jgi:hypothetical protein
MVRSSQFVIEIELREQAALRHLKSQISTWRN